MIDLLFILVFRSRHKSTSEALFTKPQHIKFMEQGQECENLSENEQGTTVEDSLLYKHSGPVVVIVTNNTDASDKGSQNNCK